MKKTLLSLIFFFNFSFASYSVYFSGIKLGDAQNFDTLKDNYLQATVTNSVAKFLLGRDTFIFYDEYFNLEKDEKNIKYKKDKNQIIQILKRATNNDLQPGRITINEKKYIDVSFDKNYKFKYVSNEKTKSEGYFIIENKELIKFVETVNNIEISKN